MVSIMNEYEDLVSSPLWEWRGGWGHASRGTSAATQKEPFAYQGSHHLNNICY